MQPMMVVSREQKQRAEYQIMNFASRTWSIQHRRPDSRDLGDIIKNPFVGEYADAVMEAHRIFQEMPHKHLVTVHGDSAGLHWYHWIGVNGEVHDRNTNGGAAGYPASYQIKFSREENAYVAA
jgi:hypothetical protein